jgi:hypothetical protein
VVAVHQFKTKENGLKRQTKQSQSLVWFDYRLVIVRAVVEERGLEWSVTSHGAYTSTNLDEYDLHWDDLLGELIAGSLDRINHAH